VDFAPSVFSPAKIREYRKAWDISRWQPLMHDRDMDAPREIIQLKVRILGISPMIWHRVMVPATMLVRAAWSFASCHGMGEHPSVRLLYLCGAVKVSIGF